MKTFDVTMDNLDKFKVKVIYKTDNFILHRQVYLLKQNFNSKKRLYTITWYNDRGEDAKFMDIYDVNIDKIKLAMQFIQNNKNLKNEYNNSRKALGQNNNMYGLMVEYRDELNFNKGDNL